MPEMVSKTSLSVVIIIQGSKVEFTGPALEQSALSQKCFLIFSVSYTSVTCTSFLPCSCLTLDITISEPQAVFRMGAFVFALHCNLFSSGF